MKPNTALQTEYWGVFKRCFMIAKLRGETVVSNAEFGEALVAAGLIPEFTWEHFDKVYYYFLCELKRLFLISSTTFTTAYIGSSGKNKDPETWPTQYRSWRLTLAGQHVLETEAENKVWLDWLNSHG